MSNTDLGAELDSYLKDYPWLGKLGLSPYSNLLGGRMLKWLENGPEDDGYPVLHISQPAGEELADVLAIIAAAYATNKAWENYQEPALPHFNNGDLVRLEIAGKVLDAHFGSYSRNDLDLGKRVVLSRTENGEHLMPIPIAPSAIGPSPAQGPTVWRGARDPFDEFNRHALQHSRNSKLDRLLTRRGTFGSCLEELRQHVLICTTSKTHLLAIAKSIHFGDFGVDKLVELERSGIRFFKKNFDNCVSGKLDVVLAEINNELLPRLIHFGIITDDQQPHLESMSIAGLTQWLTEQKRLAGEQPGRALSSVSEITEALLEELENVPDDLFDLSRTLCIICKGYTPLMETDDGFERLLRMGARMVIVGSPVELANALRDQPEAVMLNSRAEKFLSIGIATQVESDGAVEDWQDTQVVAALDRVQTPITLISLSGRGPDHGFIAPRSKLFEGMAQIPNADLRNVVYSQLMPVMRTLSMLPLKLAGDTKDWVNELLSEARERIAPLETALPETLFKDVMDCLKAIEDVRDLLVEWDGEKGLYIDGLNEYLYRDYDTGYDYDELRPYLITLGGDIPEEPVDDGEDSRPAIALTGWNGNRALAWLHKHLKKGDLKEVRIVGYESDIRKWKAALFDLYDWKKLGFGPSLVSEELKDWNPFVLTEKSIEGHTPQVQLPVVEPAEIDGTNGPDEELETERKVLRVHPSSKGEGERTINTAICVQFREGGYMLYPEEGHLDLFSLDASGVIGVKPEDLIIGVKLVWVAGINDLLRMRALSKLAPADQEQLYAWRKELELVMRNRYRHDRSDMAQAMERAGFTSAYANLGRWLYNDMYAPQTDNLRKIMKFSRGAVFSEEDMGRFIKGVRSATQKARDQRRKAREEVLKALNSAIIINELRENGSTDLSLFQKKISVSLLQVEDSWTESGEFSFSDMYTIIDA